MRTIDIPGAWFGDALPSGEYAATIPNVSLVTHHGPVALPADEPWGIGYPRITIVGGFHVAGQAHTLVNVTWTWDGEWDRIDGPCVGVSPVIFDRAGVLHINDGYDGSIGSQGYRYVAPDGSLVTGDATYSAPQWGLNEYTDIGDGLIVGQGHESGLCVWDGTVLRELEPGNVRFVRANRAGDILAIAATLPDRVRCYWLTVAELRALPVQKPTPPSPPEPPKPPEPPMPEDTMEMPADVYTTYTAVVVKFPHTGDDEDRRAAQEKAVATIRARHGERWVWKTEHSNLSAPSKDGLGYVPEKSGTPVHGQKMSLYIFDMINGTTRQPNPRGKSEPLRAAFVLLPAAKDWLAGTEPPPPEPPKPPSDLGARVAAIERRLEAVDAHLAAIQTVVTHADAIATTAQNLAAEAVTTAQDALEKASASTVKVGDPVWTAGRMSLNDLFSRTTVTWTGKIGTPPK